MKTERPIACNLEALDMAERNRRAELATRLLSLVRGTVPTPDGYVFSLPFGDQTLLEIVEFILLERRCCPFLNFQISLRENDNAITITLNGREGVKESLALEFDLECARQPFSDECGQH